MSVVGWCTATADIYLSGVSIFFLERARRNTVNPRYVSPASPPSPSRPPPENSSNVGRLLRGLIVVSIESFLLPTLGAIGMAIVALTSRPGVSCSWSRRIELTSLSLAPAHLPGAATPILRQLDSFHAEFTTSPSSTTEPRGEPINHLHSSLFRVPISCKSLSLLVGSTAEAMLFHRRKTSLLSGL